MKRFLQLILIFTTVFIASGYFTLLFRAWETQELVKIWPVVTFGLGGIVVGSLFTAYIALEKIKTTVNCNSLKTS
jgi:uncharacterized integral membrane protein